VDVGTDSRIEGLPDWLEEAPTSVPAPVAASAPLLLPFKDLQPRNFERLIVRFARRLIGNAEHVQLFGEEGQKQDGIDLYLRLHPAPTSGRGYVTIQCRNVTALTPAGILKLVSEFLVGRWADESDAFVLATRARTERTELALAIEDAARKLSLAGIRFWIWDGDFLSDQLRLLPDIVTTFFGEPTRRLFCLPPPDSPDTSGPTFKTHL